MKINIFILHLQGSGGDAFVLDASSPAYGVTEDNRSVVEWIKRLLLKR